MTYRPAIGNRCRTSALPDGKSRICRCLQSRSRANSDVFVCRIFKAAGEFAKEYELEYFDTKNVTFTVVESDQANAFVLPGNHVFCKFFCA